MTEPSPNEIMAAYAANAVNFAHSQFGISLDYTVDSIVQVETLANRLFHTRPNAHETAGIAPANERCCAGGGGKRSIKFLET